MSKTTINEIEVNGVKYVPKSTISEAPEICADGYCIVRTRSAGVFAGWLPEWDGGLTGTVSNARRLWFWSGAASLSQLAMEGVKNPTACKFAMPVPTLMLTEIIEVILCSKAAFDNIRAVPEWKQ
jgi:hypothetical protein